MSTLRQSTVTASKVRRLLSGPDNLTAATIATAAMPTTTNSMPVYDKDGNILGYVALYATASLT